MDKTSPKKIVIDARIINSSTGRYVERLLTYLQEIDKDNQYVVLVPKKDIDYWKPTSPNFRLLLCKYRNYSLGEQVGFAIQLYSLKADLVHFCMPQQPLFYFKPHVTTVHDLTLLKTYNSDKNWLIFHFKQMVGKVVFWWVGRSSRHILVPSLSTRREYLDFSNIDPSRVSVTYEAADVSNVLPRQHDVPFSTFLLYVGQQSDYKNIRRLINAHQLLLASYPQLGLVLVGSKSKLTLVNEAWVQKNNFENIYFSGRVDDDELAWLYSHCAAYVFPSLMEGFGLPGLEAMTYGAPVVCSDATSLPEIYGQAAIYFNPLSVSDMAEKINSVLENDDVRTQLVKKGYERTKRYSWRKMAAQTHQVYRSSLTKQ